MGLETVNYIDDLNESWPIGNVDHLDESDDHHRAVKKAVKGSFPNLGQGAVTVTAAELNTVVEALAGSNPIGAIIMYNASFAAIPSNWQLCNGSNGTPDMVNRFVYGTNTELDLKDTGGTATATMPSHTHTIGSHAHTYDYAGQYSAQDIGIMGDGAAPRGINNGSWAIRNTSTSPATVTGAAGSGDNIPPYIKLAYIQRMS